MAFPTLSTNPEFPLTEETLDSVIRSDFEGGYQLTRQKFTRIRHKWTLQYKYLTAADKTLLDTFINTTTLGGSASFTWTHPATSVSYTVRFEKPPVLSLDFYGEAYHYSTEMVLVEV